MALFPMVTGGGTSGVNFPTTRYDADNNTNKTIPVTTGKKYILISCGYLNYSDYSVDSSYGTTFVSGANVLKSHCWQEQGLNNTYYSSVQYYLFEATANNIVVKKSSGLGKVSWELIELG